VWKPEPGSGGRGRPNGQPERAAVEDDRLLDHHIEEILGAFGDLARIRETTPDEGRPPPG
jgi:hypothetical protein